MPNRINQSIIEYIKAGADRDAFDKVFDLLQDFKEFEIDILLLNSQFVKAEEDSLKGIVDDYHINISINQIRYSFIQILNKFRDNTLSKFFNISPFKDEINDLESQDELILKVMHHRLEPLGYYLVNSYTQSESATIQGKSSIIIPIKKDSDNYAVAQILRKVKLSDTEKVTFRRILNLRHRNLIRMLHCQLSNFPYFVINEYVYGKTLASSLQTVGPRPVSQVIDWLYQLANVLLYLSQKNIDHFNVRPSKIFIDDEFQLLISPIDLMGGESKTEENFEYKYFWEICKYGSPEFLNDYGAGSSIPINQRFVCASSQFSMGAIAYYALTGRELFEGNTVRAILEKRDLFEMDSESFLAPLELLPKLIVDGNLTCFSSIIRKLLSINKEERFSNLYSLIKELNKFIHVDYAIPNQVQSSYRRAIGNNSDLMSDFYTKLFEKSPIAKEKFSNIYNDKVKMNRQHSMLQMAVDILIDIDKPESQNWLQKIFIENSHSNTHYSLSLDSYKDFLDILIETIEESDPDFQLYTKIEWIKVKDRFLEAIRIINPDYS